MNNSKRIIIVEDDKDFRESMVESLVLSGFDVTGVASALEFYRELSTNKYLLAILDLGLPDQNGMILAQYIRSNTDMRIIVLTAQSSLDSRITAYQAGADIYLLKPVDFSELAASIHSILGRVDCQSFVSRKENDTEPDLNKETREWQLVRSDMYLHSPKHEIIKLSSKEFDLIEALASSSSKIVARQDLLNTLGYSNNKYGNRSLDVLIYRLRKKKATGKTRIPIKTFHGSGYGFSAPIAII
ncbi:response regulator transcription factor [Prosthecochloris sp. SCSIO W1101]|uniref:response regulator transcription factor n=1 Tax=Prosthecochloris sp. SCSIO W1101 TaxID=2992242 RepID=UPI00223D58AB|nr:response regulator transcription factor [Prosthecochloris sp. SCSIO W1101]UZJ40445.1 response regulator transcription factor [Prosthecochloris sp. SCSIO W1101]